jgi:hypothetical protein
MVARLTKEQALQYSKQVRYEVESAVREPMTSRTDAAIFYRGFFLPGNTHHRQTKEKMRDLAIAHFDGTAAPLPRPVETAGETFADGSQIDLVASLENGNLRLALWDGTKETISSSILCKGQTYIPVRLQPGLIRDMTLPSRCQPHDSTRTFLCDICSLIKKFTGLDDKSVSLVSRIVLLSAVVDAVPVALTLLIVGPDVGRAKQLLALLRCICRHPLRLTGVTRSALASLPSGMQFSYLISQPGFSKNLKNILDIASSRDEKILVHGDLIDLFGLRVLHISSGFVADDFWPLHPIQISITPIGRVLPILDLDLQRRITDDYQAKLLSFRRVNLGGARRLKFDASALSLPLRSTARALAAATPDDPQLQTEVFDLLKDTDENIRNDRFIDLDCVTVEAVLVAAHESAAGAIYISELATIVQQILHGRGEESPAQPGLLGKRLKGLGFPTRRDARGSKLLLNTTTITHAKQLARDLDVVAREPPVKSQAQPNR